MLSIYDLSQRIGQRPLIAAHRGLSGGNIPGNTLVGFDAALFQGADMVELDVERGRSGKLYVFHGGLETAHLGCPCSLTELSDEEIAVLRHLNQDMAPTVCPVSTLDEVLEHLKGRCYINIDKFALYPGAIAEVVRRHGMLDQVVVKTDAREDVLKRVEREAPDLAYIAIMKAQDRFTPWLLNSPIRFIGVECVFETEDVPICSPAYIKAMHKKGLVLWGNGIVFDHRRVLSAGHNDDISICGRMDEGWGWLLDRGFDIVQTDWPAQLRAYMDGRAQPTA